ncbi:hypothetical protein BWI96_03915 [Siphonobacter sp. SORGH_AS_0500]|nr:hypothetical protein BWI96_03915 [Siphonobacter sp. SORGH_AS_0500]
MVILPIDRSGETVLSKKHYAPPTKNVKFSGKPDYLHSRTQSPNGRASLGIGAKFPVLDTLNFEKEELKDYLST